MMRIFRRLANRFQRQPGPDETKQILAAIAEDSMTRIKPMTCCVCGKAPQVQLIPEDTESVETVDEMIHEGTRYEFICYEDLGSFMEVFTDQKIREWTLVRL